MDKKESKKKLSKKQTYIFVAIAVVVIAVIAYLGIMLKKPVIGYQPDIPQEWYEQIEAEKNSPTVTFVRTYDLHGVWKQRGTGKYYNVNTNGNIYDVNTPDEEPNEFGQWGTVFAEQVIDRKIAENLSHNGGNMLVEGDEYTLLINSMYTDVYNATAVIIDEKTIKTITEKGNELVFERVKVFETESETDE